MNGEDGIRDVLILSSATRSGASAERLGIMAPVRRSAIALSCSARPVRRPYMMGCPIANVANVDGGEHSHSDADKCGNHSHVSRWTLESQTQHLDSFSSFLLLQSLPALKVLGSLMLFEREN